MEMTTDKVKELPEAQLQEVRKTAYELIAACTEALMKRQKTDQVTVSVEALDSLIEAIRANDRLPDDYRTLPRPKLIALSLALVRDEVTARYG